MFTTATKRCASRLRLVLVGLLAIGCATTSDGHGGGAGVRAHDPLEQQTKMEWVRREILHKTANVSAQRYVAEGRPQLHMQLANLGFSETEIQLIFAGVDPQRAGRANATGAARVAGR